MAVQSYSAPVVELRIGGMVLHEVRYLEVEAARTNPVATLRLEVQDPKGEVQNAAVDLAPISAAWGYRGADLEPIFEGVITRIIVPLQRSQPLVVEAACRMTLLARHRVTRTYAEETPGHIVRHLVEDAGLQDHDIAGASEPLDRLPLVDNTVIEALALLEARIRLGHTAWCDATGVFHWEPKTEDGSPGAKFAFGENILAFEYVPGGISRLETLGNALWHGGIVHAVGEDGIERAFFIERVRHRFGPSPKGARTTLWLSEVADA